MKLKEQPHLHSGILHPRREKPLQVGFKSAPQVLRNGTVLYLSQAGSFNLFACYVCEIPWIDACLGGKKEASHQETCIFTEALKI